MLNREEIEVLIRELQLVEEYIDLKTQATPNGFDLTAETISEFDTQGQLDFSNKERKIPAGRILVPQKDKPAEQPNKLDSMKD